MNFDFESVFDDLADWELGKSDFWVLEHTALSIMAQLLIKSIYRMWAATHSQLKDLYIMLTS